MDGSIAMVRDKSAWVAADRRFDPAWVYCLTAGDLADIAPMTPTRFDAHPVRRPPGSTPTRFDAYVAKEMGVIKELVKTAKIPTN